MGSNETQINSPWFRYLNETKTVPKSRKSEDTKQSRDNRSVGGRRTLSGNCRIGWSDSTQFNRPICPLRSGPTVGYRMQPSASIFVKPSASGKASDNMKFSVKPGYLEKMKSPFIEVLITRVLYIWKLSLGYYWNSEFQSVIPEVIELRRFYIIDKRTNPVVQYGEELFFTVVSRNTSQCYILW